METVEVVIRIPCSELEYAKKGYTKAKADVVYRAIENGTVLPKGHGRIGDLDGVRAKVFNASMDSHFIPIKLLTCDDVTDIIDNIPTIIEADKET